MAECRANLYDDTAITTAHQRERRAGAVHVTHVGDISDPAVERVAGVPEEPQCADEGDVDPHIHRTELGLDPLRGDLDLVQRRDVALQRKGPTAQLFDVRRGSLQAGVSTGEDGDVVPMSGELPNDGTTHTGGTAGHYDNATLAHAAGIPSQPMRKRWATTPDPLLLLAAATLVGFGDFYAYGAYTPRSLRLVAYGCLALGAALLIPRVRSLEPMRDIRRQVERQTGATQKTGGSERFTRV